jgi:hypothetical protein
MKLGWIQNKPSRIKKSKVQTEGVGLLCFLFLHHLKTEKIARQKRGG